MSRDERIQTSVNEETKKAFRVEAAKRDMDMSELMRELIYEHLEKKSEDWEKPQGNPKGTTKADC